MFVCESIKPYTLYYLHNIMSYLILLLIIVIVYYIFFKYSLERFTEKLKNPNKPTDEPTDEQTDEQTDEPTDEQTDDSFLSNIEGDIKNLKDKIDSIEDRLIPMEKGFSSS